MNSFNPETLAEKPAVKTTGEVNKMLFWIIIAICAIAYGRAVGRAIKKRDWMALATAAVAAAASLWLYCHR